jgi:hypothetical protein|nr:MAG TPA: hypothetical protein [Caudoviricetes sp.]
MKKSDIVLWTISILSFVGMLVLLIIVLTLMNKLAEYKGNYYELLDIISQMNNKIHYPGG